MKALFLKTIIAAIFILSVFSCGTNIFTPLNPNDVNTINDINTLLAMGDTRIRNLDYSGAYEVYAKVLTLDSRSSKALDGISTAYLYMNIPYTDFFNAIKAGKYGLLDLNVLYRVAGFISPKLYQISSGDADGVIPNTDVNVNFNFYIFNTFNMVFDVCDSDGNKIVENDVNDLIILNKQNGDITVSNKMANYMDVTVPANLIKLFGIAHYLRLKQNDYTNAKARGTASLNLASTKMTTTEGKNMLQNNADGLAVLTGPIDSAYVTLDTNLLTNNVITTYLQFATILSTAYPYTQFTNALFNEGITNPNDITNGIRDMTNAYAPLLTRYGRGSL